MTRRPIPVACEGCGDRAEVYPGQEMFHSRCTGAFKLRRLPRYIPIERKEDRPIKP